MGFRVNSPYGSLWFWYLTLYSINTHFDTSTTDSFWKHGKRRNCLEWGISSFPTMFSTKSDNCIAICSYFWHHIFFCCWTGRSQDWHMRLRVNKWPKIELNIFRNDSHTRKCQNSNTKPQGYDINTGYSLLPFPPAYVVINNLLHSTVCLSSFIFFSCLISCGNLLRNICIIS